MQYIMIKMKFVLVVLALVVLLPLQAQRYMTKNGNISFFSETPMENIEAHNKQVNAALDLGNGNLVFKVLMKSFEFEKALMQEHFNENYVESDKYPTASFNGKVMNTGEFGKDSKGAFQVMIAGELTIHGVTRKVREKGTLEWKGEAIHGKSVFKVAVADYDISIPKAVMNNIAKEIEVRVDVMMNPLER